MNGIICIATRTKANEEIISEKNGVLTEDNVPGLLAGMEKVVANMEKYNSRELSHSVSNSKWETIVSNFHRYLKSIDSRRLKELGNVKEV